MSARPIYLPQDAVSPAVLAAENEIVRQCGLNHVGERYFASQADCAAMRRVEAERTVRENLRDRARLRTCCFCLEKIEQGEETIVLAEAVLHKTPCAMDHYYMSASYPTDADFAEQLDGTDAPIAEAA